MTYGKAVSTVLALKPLTHPGRLDLPLGAQAVRVEAEKLLRVSDVMYCGADKVLETTAFVMVRDEIGAILLNLSELGTLELAGEHPLADLSMTVWTLCPICYPIPCV